MVASAFSPSEWRSTGTSRQETTRRWRSTASRARSSQSKTVARPCASPRSSRGTWIRSPAPSPLLPSASSPPRCESRARASTASATASWPRSGVATKPMPQAARAAGIAPAQARRVLSTAGGTEAKTRARRPNGLVGQRQKRPRFVICPLQAEKRLDPQRHRQVEASFRVLEVEAGDLADAVEPVAQRVRMHAQALRGLLLLAGLEVGAQRRHERRLARGVVLDQRAEVAPAVVDEPLVTDRREQAGEAELGYGDDLAPAFEAGQRLHHGGHLAQRALDRP